MSKPHNSAISKAPSSPLGNVMKVLNRDKYLMLLVLPTFLYFLIFCYIPMAGNYMAFTDYKIGMSMFDAPFVGFKWFREFFNTPEFARNIKNTLILSFLSLLFTFPAPVIFALMLNELRSDKFKGVVQTLSYMPYFVSTVIVVGILKNILSVDGGIINTFIGLFGVKPIDFMAESSWFRTLYIASDIWQTTGWGSIVYLGALSAIDSQLYEAAYVDGANRWHRLVHVTLPGITSTVVMMLIIRAGSIMSVGYEKILLMYIPLTYDTADVLQTFVYRRGLEEMQYSFATAVGLFNSVINLALMLIVNKISVKMTETGLW